jgi:hypothetical protein
MQLLISCSHLALLAVLLVDEQPVFAFKRKELNWRQDFC